MSRKSASGIAPAPWLAAAAALLALGAGCLLPAGGCNAAQPLAMDLVNQTGTAVALNVTVFDSTGATVFHHAYALDPEETENTGAVATAQGVYLVEIRTDAGAWGRANLRVEECYFGAVASIGNTTVTIAQAVS